MTNRDTDEANRGGAPVVPSYQHFAGTMPDRVDAVRSAIATDNRDRLIALTYDLRSRDLADLIEMGYTREASEMARHMESISKASKSPTAAPPKCASCPILPPPCFKAMKVPTRYNSAKISPGTGMGIRNSITSVPGTRKIAANMTPQTPPEAPSAEYSSFR